MENLFKIVKILKMSFWNYPRHYKNVYNKFNKKYCNKNFERILYELDK